MCERDEGSWLWRRGDPHPPERPRPLRGPHVVAALRGPDLVDVRPAAGGDWLRAIGVRVRDGSWGTVPGVVTSLRVAEDDCGFVVDVDVAHRSAPIDFTWHGTYRSSGSAIEVAMRGRAGCTFETNRLGLVLLIAPRALVGRRYRAEGPAGSTEGAFPDLVGPQLIVHGEIQPLFPSFRKLDVEGAGGSVRLEFAGDLFETEDQRNWTDDSFKVYSTPIGSPIPHRVEAGEEIEQVVRLTFPPPVDGHAGQTARPPGARSSSARRRSDRVPDVGLALDGDRHALTGSEIAAIRRIAPAHVRADVAADARGMGALAGAVVVAESLDCDLELAVHLPADVRKAVGGLEALADPIRRAAPCRVLLLRDGERTIGAASLALAAAALRSADVALVGATNENFAELNRDRPDATAISGLAWAANPQVHDTDDATVLASSEGVAATVLTAAAFAPGLSVHVTPLTLRPGVRSPDSRRAATTTADPRHPTLFAAVWTLATVAALARAGAESATFFELTGEHGIVPRSAGTRPTPYPAGAILGVASQWRGRPLLESSAFADDPLLAVLEVEDREGVDLMVGNLSPDDRAVDLRGLAAPRAIVLDEAVDIERFLAGGGDLEGVSGGGLVLGPYAVARIRGHRAV